MSELPTPPPVPALEPPPAPAAPAPAPAADVSPLPSMPEYEPPAPPEADPYPEPDAAPETAPAVAEPGETAPAAVDGPELKPMGQELEPVDDGPEQSVEEAAEKMGLSVAAMLELFTYLRLMAQLAKAGMALRGVGARVRSTYDYVGDCAKSVDFQVGLAAHLDVDPNTLAEHRQAAQVMRGALASARRMANNAEEMAVLFAQAEAGHRADYGPIAEHAANMPGGIRMANRVFYRKP
ncbi:hypothetical protein ACIQV3_35855 [Streptomyces sp. NPDC099050]|uniref:hypothetical protein n=1 Tax=Streptomyces sp. NPDC099050 TaxID=3366100 RepID=UPI00380A3F43